MTDSVTPLHDLRILDIGEGVAGPFAAKLLGDLGADVVKLEAPGVGDTSRTWGPFADDRPHVEGSAAFFFFNTSKRSIELDPTTQAGRDQLAQLVVRYDVVIASCTAEDLDEQGVGYDQLRAWNPRVILTTVSGFGSFGPQSHFKSSHLVACAMGGWSQLCGVPEREPLQTGGVISETLAGSYAASATLLAVLGRARHGHGEHVDVSVQQAVLAGAQIPTLLYEYRGLVPERYSSVGSGAGAGYMLPTRDGYIGLNALTLAQWHMLCEFLGHAEVAEDPHYANLSWATPDARLEEIRALFRTALASRSAAELFHAAQRVRVPFGLVPSLQDLFGFPPHRERHFFVSLEHPVAGRVEVPGVPYLSSAQSPQPRRPPLLGEHTDEVLNGLGDLKAPSEPASGPASLPLAGLRVLDLSMFFAGPVAAQIAADAGADVIKVESVQRIDGWRGSGTGEEPDAVPSWEASPYFNWVNRNKRDVTLNLKDPRGVAAVKTLVRSADMLIENYTPRVMHEFGLSYETLAAINPRLIMISLSGFGAEVSWRDYVAFGMSTEQMSGVSHLTGYAGGEPLFTGMTGGDLFAGVMGSTALFAALLQRETSGVGQHLDFSQMEACNLYVGDAMTGCSLAGIDPGRTGNAHPVFAPQGIYPCRAARWLGITCATDAQWQALADVIDPNGDLAGCYATGAARRAARAELDERIAGWTGNQNHLQLMHSLQAAGVPAGAVLQGPEMLADEHLRSRTAFLAQDRPGLGVKHYPNQPYRFRNAPPPPERRAPLLGEHMVEVLTELAGITDEEIAELVIDDVIGTVPMAAR